MNKIRIMPVNHVSFVNHLCFAHPIESVHNVVHNLPVGGCLKDFGQIWASKGASQRVVSILKNGYNLLFKVKPPLTRDRIAKSRYANPLRNSYLQQALHCLLDKQAIEMVKVQSSLAFYNRLYSVPKPNKLQQILELSSLNKFLKVQTFTIETSVSIRLSLQTGEWVSSLDFSDAYFHIPISQTSRKYLRFHC